MDHRVKNVVERSGLMPQQTKLSQSSLKEKISEDFCSTRRNLVNFLFQIFANFQQVVK